MRHAGQISTEVHFFFAHAPCDLNNRSMEETARGDALLPDISVERMRRT